MATPDNTSSCEKNVVKCHSAKLETDKEKEYIRIKKWNIFKESRHTTYTRKTQWKQINDHCACAEISCIPQYLPKSTWTNICIR